MRTLVIGDIHGCSQALDHLLESVNPKHQDTLITLGDYVNKGKDAKGVLDRLISLSHQGNLIPLKGNHEILMLQGRHNPRIHHRWLEKGGKATLKSYAKDGKTASLRDIPVEHWDFIEKVCVDSHETETHIFVHANLAPHLPVCKQSTYKLFWEKFNHPAPHYSGKVMICGHTSQKNGQPINLGHAICIDTWAWGKGWLTCLEVETGKLWQTNQRGELKVSDIQDYYHPPQALNEGSPIFAVVGSFFSKAVAISSRGR